MAAALIQKFYLVEKIHPWRNLTMQDGKPLQVDTRSMGFCPVYDDFDKAKKDWPNEEIQTLVVSFKPKT